MRTTNFKVRCRRFGREFWMICEEISHDLWAVKWSVSIVQKTLIKNIQNTKNIQHTSPQVQQQALSNTIPAPYIDEAYPGCPYCQDRSFAECGNCKKLYCWDGQYVSNICPWCGSPGVVSRTIENMSGSPINAFPQISRPRQSYQQVESPLGIPSNRLIDSPKKHK